MDTTTSSITKLFLAASNNHFPLKLFPDFQGSDAIVNRILLTNSDLAEIWLDIHCAPSVSVRKWGTWSQDYNVVVLKFAFAGIHNLLLKNWQFSAKSKLSIIKQESTLNFEISNKDWSFCLEASAVSFLEADAYFSEGTPWS